jgi:hypothetical protein
MAASPKPELNSKPTAAFPHLLGYLAGEVYTADRVWNQHPGRGEVPQST